MHLQAASGQCQGVLANHQHQEDQPDLQVPVMENNTNMSTHAQTEISVSVLIRLQS